MKFVNSVNPTNKEAINLERCTCIQASFDGARASLTFYHGETDLSRWCYEKQDLSRFDKDVGVVCDAMQCDLQLPEYVVYKNACETQI